MDQLYDSAQDSLEEKLTWREMDILSLLGDHLSNTEIANRLHLSLHSVKWYVRQIFGKLGVSNRREAVLRAQLLRLNHGSQNVTKKNRTGNLPAPISSFIGRKEELSYLIDAIANKHSRMITLIGTGGIGKTRLVIEAARQVSEHFPEGTWLVDLAPVFYPAQVAQIVSAELGIWQNRANTGSDDFAETIHELGTYLKTNKILLILDNCEHLLSVVAQLASSLLQTCPQIVILMTSREPMGITGEVVFQVPPLSISDPQSADAVQLFRERAEAVVNNFSLTEENTPVIERICQRLDGIPLAIEMAAARISTLSPAQIADRLDDRFLLLTGGSHTALPRHRTLRASIDWSYNLLGDKEQKLFHGLSVFVGGWSLEAAEALWASQKSGKYDVVDELTSLVNKSFVQVIHNPNHEPLFRMLETIRQYAQEKLANAGDGTAIRDRHLEYYLSFAERMQPALRTAQRLSGLNQLEAERENFRAALRWSFENNDRSRAEKGLRLAAALVDLWKMEGLFQEGRDWIQKGLAVVDQHTPSRRILHARALSAAGVLSMGLSDYWQARQFFEQSIELYRTTEDLSGLAETLILLADGYGWDVALHHNETKARRRVLAKEALALSRQCGNHWVQAFVLYWSTTLESLDELVTDYSIFDPKIQEAVKLFLETGDRWSAVPGMRDLGVHASLRGDHTDAHQYLTQAVDLCREEKNKWETVNVLSNLGDVAYFQGEYDLVERYFREAQEISREIGFKAGESWSIHHRGVAARRQGDVQRAARLYQEGLDLAEGYPICYYKELLLGSAGIAIEQKRPAQATTLFGAVEALAELYSGAVIYIPQAELEKDLAAIHAMLDEVSITKYWAEGCLMTMEQAIQLAKDVCRTVSTDS